MVEKSQNQPLKKGKGPPDNKSGTKLKDPDIRQEAFRQYCEHLASGYPKEAFFFEHPTHSVTWETMEKYIKENPNEFSPILIKRAIAARYRHWLDKGKSLMEGQFKGGSPTVWMVIMRNIFKDIGWDKLNKNEEVVDTSMLDALANLFASVHEASCAPPSPKPDGVENSEKPQITPGSFKTNFP